MDTTSTERDVEPKDGLLKSTSNYNQEERETLVELQKLQTVRETGLNHIIEKGEEENWL
jgi:hypothetical protein